MYRYLPAVEVAFFQSHIPVRVARFLRWCFFRTNDTGKTWSVSAVLAEPFGYVARISTAVVQSSLKTASIANATLTLITVEPGGGKVSVGSAIGSVADISSVYQLSFTDSEHGLLLGSAANCTSLQTGCTQLILTSDGGGNMGQCHAVSRDACFACQ